MTVQEAERLTAMLFASYPGKREDLTVAVYVSKLAPLQYDRMLAAINDCVDCEKFLPTVALLKEVYARLAPRFTPLALEEHKQTVEERDRALEIVRSIRDRFPKRKGLPDDLQRL